MPGFGRFNNNVRYRSETSRQNVVDDFSVNFLVTVYSSCHGAVVARLPEELQLQSSAEWDAALAGGGPAGITNYIAQEVGGVSTRTQFASAQVWSGNAPGELVLPLEFYAQDNPKIEVVDPIIKLNKMLLPRLKGREGGLFVPPGPRTILRNKSHDQITIDVGNFLFFTNVVITNVSQVFVTRDMTQSGLPLRASCEVTFRTLFSLTGNQFEAMFKK